MNCRFKVFMVFVFMAFSNGEESLEVCKQKLTEERELYKNDKARLKLHLQKTRHNVRVYQRMVQVMVDISTTWSFFTPKIKLNDMTHMAHI